MVHIVEDFYHKIQFPGHFSQKEILKKTEDFFLTKFLTLDYLPFKGKILEAGCGTGYTTHVIANLRRDVQILGTDFSKGSLEFASNFSKQNNYQNITFQWMDLRNIDIPEKSFDMVICSGVLHHIENPRPIFSNICNLLKKNGTMIVGLYHPYGRTSTHIRQQIFKITKGRMRWIDPRIRNENWMEQRKIIWYKDQYQHPYERDYDQKLLKKWFDEEGITLVGSIPEFTGSNIGYNFYMLTKTGSQGGLYIFVGKKS